MKKEQRFRMKVDVKGNIKTYYPKSEEQKNENLRKCRELGYKVIECVKLYPFNTYKNQHNFDLIRTISLNDMYDMQNGDKPWDDELFEILEKRVALAERFMDLELPVAWIPYSDWAEAKEMATAAILHREEACIRNGRLDLIQYCEW